MLRNLIPRNIIAKTSFVILAVSLLPFDLQAKRKKQYFNEASFEVDFEITHKIMPLEIISGGNKELVIVGAEAQNESINSTQRKQPIVAIYQKVDNALSYELLKKINLPFSTIAFDSIKLPQHKNAFVLIDSQKISLLDLASGEFSKIADVNSIYLQDKPQFVAKKKLVKDLNSDGLDDILIPSFKKMTLFLQTKDALNPFIENSLPINAVVDMSSSQISFSEQKYFIQDINFDGLSDFVLVKNGKLTSYNQKELGQFSDQENPLLLPFDFSGLPWWLQKGADGETADQSNLKHSMLEDIKDINGDGVLDIMVRQTVSSGVLDREISYDFYFGFDKDGKLSYEEKPQTNISAEGTLSDLKLIDMNHDGKLEVLVSSFDIGVSQIIGALMSGSIDQDVFIFSLDDKDQFGEEPIFEEEVSLSFSLSSGQSGQPAIITMDSNGDRQKDILLSVGEKRLNVFHGLEQNEGNQELFNTRSKRQRTKVPADGSMIISSDLNQDGKDEVIMHYGKQDDESLKNKIVILSAK
jgi:hypothetical protein